MDMSNRFSKLPREAWGRVFLVIFFSLYLSPDGAKGGGVLPFFDVTKRGEPLQTTFEVQGFMAEDPVSLRSFFKKWDGPYHPRSGDNFALEMLRTDFGVYLSENCYLGYFYQRDLFVTTNKGFVDGFHALKNKITPTRDQHYDIFAKDDGIERHGLLLSKRFLVDIDGDRSIVFGIGGYLSYDTDMQHGSLSGDGTMHPDDTYDASADVGAYYFNKKNYLYKGWDFDSSYGIGVGLNLGIEYRDKKHGLTVKALINDLFSRSYWKNLPYVHDGHIQTKNQHIGDDGYIHYDPVADWYENYTDYTQHIPLKLHFSLSQELPYSLTIEGGMDYVKSVLFPYLELRKKFEYSTVGISYEERYGSFGIEYRRKNFYVKSFANGFSKTSSIGLSLGVSYKF
jgi:hypothetical protein